MSEEEIAKEIAKVQIGWFVYGFTVGFLTSIAICLAIGLYL